MLVEHQSERPALLAHLAEAIEQVERLGQHKGTANLARDLVGRGQRDPDGALGGGAAKEVVDEEHAFNLVEVAVDHGKAGVAGVTHGLGDCLGGDGNGEEHHVDARRHDVAQFELA
jgi:hypothetical protein